MQILSDTGLCSYSAESMRLAVIFDPIWLETFLSRAIFFRAFQSQCFVVVKAAFELFLSIDVGAARRESKSFFSTW